MSFFTSVHFYRPTKPPVVTVASLAKFLRSFATLQITTKSMPVSADIKFGDAIDMDDRLSSWDKPLSEFVSEFHEIEWDVSIQGKFLDSLAGARNESIGLFLIWVL